MRPYSYFRATVFSGCAAFLLLIAGNGTAAASGDCSEVRVNGSSNWFPVSMRRTPESRLEGVFPDLAEKVFTGLDVPIVPGPDMPWKRLLVLLENGRIDVLAGAYLARERAEKFGVSRAVISEDVAVIVRAGLPTRPENLEGLVGLRGLAPFGSSFGDSFESFAAEKLTVDRHPVDQLDQLMRLLVEEKADYLVIPRQDGEQMIDDTGSHDLVEILPWPAAVSTLHFLFSRTSPCISMLEAFDRELTRAIGDGALSGLMETYRRADAR